MHIGIGVFSAVTATVLSKSVEDVAVAVAVAFRDVLHRCRTRRSPSQSHSRSADCRHMPHSSRTFIQSQSPSTSSQMPSSSRPSAQSPSGMPHRSKSVEDVSVAVAVAFWDVRTSALVEIFPGRCTRHKRRVRPRSRPRRHRCHRHRRLQRSHHHTLQERRAGFRHSRSRLQGCPHRPHS